MTPARRQKLEEALAIIRDVNDADAWAMLTAETRTALVNLGAHFLEPALPTPPGKERVFTLTLGGVSAACAFDQGEHLLLRWAANARTALAEGEG
jgi:hypothetical protein